MYSNLQASRHAWISILRQRSDFCRQLSVLKEVCSGCWRLQPLPSPRTQHAMQSGLASPCLLYQGRHLKWSSPKRVCVTLEKRYSTYDHASDPFNSLWCVYALNTALSTCKTLMRSQIITCSCKGKGLVRILMSLAEVLNGFVASNRHDEHHYTSPRVACIYRLQGVIYSNC